MVWAAEVLPLPFHALIFELLNLGQGSTWWEAKGVGHSYFTLLGAPAALGTVKPLNWTATV